MPFGVDCPGRGLCHGCTSWCPFCGDVGQICESKGQCHQHMPCEYPGCTRVGYEGRCGEHYSYDPEAVASGVMKS